VLVQGEAGVGKTALLRRFEQELGGSARILWGACDALFTPRPFGAVLDIARGLDNGVGKLLASGAKPYEVADALLAELDRRPRPATVLVFEDLHWADEATLDVLRLVGRRISSLPAILVATYREEDLGPAHPLRIVFGELASARWVDRLQLAPLSQAAVAALADAHGLDAAELYRRTSGNPFFVTEVLASGGVDIPESVRDAVHARLARMSQPALEVVYAASIVPQPVELWLLAALVPGALSGLDECADTGVVLPTGTELAFRHELARLAVEESLSPVRRIALHRGALAALSEPAEGEPDLARLAHHAEASGDAPAVLRFASAAAEEAAAVGAHREAEAQYARALRFAGGLEPRERVDLLERFAGQGYLTGMREEARVAVDEALALDRELGDRSRHAKLLCLRSKLLACCGYTREAKVSALQAVESLDGAPPAPALAAAYAAFSQAAMLRGEFDDALVSGGRAIELAELAGETEALVNALNNVGFVELSRGDDEGLAKLGRSRDLADQADLEPDVGRAYINISASLGMMRRWAEAEHWLDEGIEYCGARGLEAWLATLLANRAESRLQRGLWADAAETATSLLSGPTNDVFAPRVAALCVLGLVRARRGDPHAWRLLDEALEAAAVGDDVNPMVAVARAEARWLAGRPEAIVAETQAAFENALEAADLWFLGELACWRRRAGVAEELPHAVAEPFGLELAGERAAAAAFFEARDCRYEAALVLAGADDEPLLRRSLELFLELEAAPAAAIVARRLRERGARGLPRGPRPATRMNPAGLTRREMDVLVLVAEGLRNQEIGDRLHLSRRTVEHHVSAILVKLDSRTRSQAVREAARLGLIDATPGRAG
jgi:DNA-binding CsgD family transcriptional regulator/tetratricopeptide (TPR) repeat protein